MRKLTEVHSLAGRNRAVIMRDADYDEYIVKFHERALAGEPWTYTPEADYHTDDYDDAIETALAWFTYADIPIAELY